MLLTLSGCRDTDTNFSTDTNNDNSQDTQAQLKSAQFVDAPVSGLDYETKSLKGSTDENGYFNYYDNEEQVVFKVGKMVIGEFNLSTMKEDKKVFPADLFGLERNVTTDDKVVKVIEFL